MINDTIMKKIDSLIHCLKRIEDKRPNELNELKSSYDIQDIISVNLERAIQISVDIASIIISEEDLPTSNTMSGSFKVLERRDIISKELSNKLQKSIGFRNISVHEYNSIDWGIVFDIIHNHLGNFKMYIESLNNYLESNRLLKNL